MSFKVPIDYERVALGGRDIYSLDVSRLSLFGYRNFLFHWDPRTVTELV